MKITIERQPDSDWTVSKDDRSCRRMSWDEMLGVVVKLTLELPPQYSMRTKEEHEDWDLTMRELAQNRGEA